MAVEAGSQPLGQIAPISMWNRIYGLGSIYAKTIRDSRLAFIIVTGVLAGMMLVAGAAIQSIYPTPASRLEVDKLIATIPSSMAGLVGRPVRVDTLGGMTSWKYGPFFALMAGLWSILALSSTLAGEAGRGSLDFVATSPLGKRRVALEKLAAHLTMMGLAMGILALSCWVTAAVFGNPALGDSITPLDAIGFGLWVGLLALASGGVAFALGPIVGRGGAAGIAGVVMVGGYVANGYASSVPGFGILANLSWFHWTADHIPLVGQFDWPALALVAVVAAGLLAAGVELFARRDLGVTTGIPSPALPAAVLGVRGPISRTFGDLLPRAMAWGIGLGLFGLVLASLTGTFADTAAKDPGMRSVFKTLFPDFDITSAGGFLQVYAQILFVVAGFAAATLVGKWGSDEADRRLEMVLTTPLDRARWAISGGVAAIAAVVVMTVLLAAGIGIGCASAGTQVGGPMIGSAALGLYAAAVVGVGIAVGGLWRTSLAAELTAALVMATFLIDLLVPALKLPDWVHGLALTAHMGQPMVGVWDPVGITACAVIAIAGITLGGLGMRRRDIV